LPAGWQIEVEPRPPFFFPSDAAVSFVRPVRVIFLVPVAFLYQEVGLACRNAGRSGFTTGQSLTLFGVSPFSFLLPVSLRSTTF